VGPVRIPDLTFRLLEPVGVLANFKSELQCSCLNSLGNKRCFPVFFVSQQEHCVFQEGADCYSSPQRGHIGSSFIFSKVKCRFSVLCPVRGQPRSSSPGPPARPLSKTHRQDRLQYTAPQLASAQCKYCKQEYMSLTCLI